MIFDEIDLPTQPLRTSDFYGYPVVDLTGRLRRN